MDYNDGNSTTYSYLPDGTLLSREYGLKYIGRKGESNGAIGIASGADSVTTDVPSLSGSQIAERPSLIVFGKTEYSGNVIYKNGKLDKVLFPGGYCTFDSENNSQPIFHYFTQDHLGNNRTVTSEDGTVEQITHYYPFGGTFNDAGLNASLQQYKYNGKELDRIAGLNTYDYGARQYFSPVPTWDRMDPQCKKYYNISPYAYCANNPVNRIDVDGKDWYYTRNGAFLCSDSKTTDNIIIRELNIRTLGNPAWQRGQPRYIDTKIADTELSVDAYSKIFSDILEKNGFELNLLKSGKIEVYKTDGLNFYEKTSQAEKSYEANAVTTHYKDKSANITAFINTCYNGTQEIFSTVSNVVNIIGGHEFYGHFLLKGNEKTAYNIQKKMPSWDKATDKLKQHVKEMIKIYGK